MDMKLKARRIATILAEEIELFRDGLTRAGIDWSGPTLEESVGKKGYSAELCVYWFRDDNLFDVFEFFVVEEGALVTSEDEVRQWTRKNVSELLNRHPQ